MKAGVLVAAMTISGILGGVVGALLVQESAAPPSPAPAATPAEDSPDRSEALSKEVAELRARLEEMQGAVSASAQDASKVRTDLEREKAAAALARTRLESLERGEGPRGVPEPGMPLRIEGGSGAVPVQLGRVSIGAGMDAGTRKALELLRKPEEERWTAIREALALSGGQEDELKAAIKERDLAIRDLTKVESREVTGPDGNSRTVTSVAAPDPEKMKEARRRYDDRVNAALTADQSKKWRDEGYETAAGGGGAMVFTSVATGVGER